MTPERRLEMYEQAIQDAEDYIATLEAELEVARKWMPLGPTTYGAVRSAMAPRGPAEADALRALQKRRQAFDRAWAKTLGRRLDR